jgi:hypothetical protein
MSFKTEEAKKDFADFEYEGSSKRAVHISDWKAVRISMYGSKINGP